MTLRCGSPHSKCRVCAPSDGSVSATGSHPNGAHASAVSGCASMAIVRTCVIPQRFKHARYARRSEQQRAEARRSSGRGAGILRRSEEAMEMDVRSIEDVAPVVEHNGTVPVWWLVNPREMKEITDGGYLELVSEFEVAGGGLVDPHSHPTHEFYYVT